MIQPVTSAILTRFLITSISLHGCLSFAHVAIAGLEINRSDIAEDFGPYSDQPENEALTLLTTSGDRTTGKSLDQARRDFYSRTNLLPANDTTQQLIDFKVAASAEREAQRILNDDNPNQAYANAIAPWLDLSNTNSSAAPPDTTLVFTDRDQPENLESATSTAFTLNPLAENTSELEQLEVRRIDAAKLAKSKSAIIDAISSLDITLESLSDSIEALY